MAVERLRAYKVVAAFVELFGEGLASLSLSGRATLANVAPEYGATMMGIAPDLDGAAAVKGIPKIASVAPARDYVLASGENVAAGGNDVAVRMISMEQAHRAIRLTGAMCTAAAVAITGSMESDARTQCGSRIARDHRRTAINVIKPSRQIGAPVTPIEVSQPVIEISKGAGKGNVTEIEAIGRRHIKRRQCPCQGPPLAIDPLLPVLLGWTALFNHRDECCIHHSMGNGGSTHSVKSPLAVQRELATGNFQQVLTDRATLDK